MILGIGIDLCDVVRMRRKLGPAKADFLAAVFLPAEIAWCRSRRDPARHLAARFAAKEALLKAMADAPGRGSFWHDVEIVGAAKGRPRLRLSGRLAGFAAGLGVRCSHLSLAHTAELAAATVVLEGDGPGTDFDPRDRRQ